MESAQSLPTYILGAPGLDSKVFTDLLLNDSTPELRKFPFGVLAAQPEEALWALDGSVAQYRIL